MKTKYDSKVIQSLQHDRRLGLSILDLVQKYDIPKTTVWYYIKNVEIPLNLKKKLLANQGGSKKRKVHREKLAEIFAAKLLADAERELTIAAVMLYWAEGHKKSFVFTNSDSKMLRLYIDFLIKILKIKTEDIVILIRITDPITEKQVMSYWPRALQLPHSVFNINHDNIQNKTKTKFGICRVMVKQSNFYHKVMMCLIFLLQNDLCSSSSTDRTSHS